MEALPTNKLAFAILPQFIQDFFGPERQKIRIFSNDEINVIDSIQISQLP